MKAHLLYYVKETIEGRYILELSIHDVGKSKQYPDGIKYGFICFDIKTKKKVLMDNHHPKGPHIHIDDDEQDYEYTSDEKLIDDFNKLVFQHLGVSI
jgi:hypothetical protein